jgi:hypothetical protein
MIRNVGRFSGLGGFVYVPACLGRRSPSSGEMIRYGIVFSGFGFHVPARLLSDPGGARKAMAG